MKCFVIVIRTTHATNHAEYNTKFFSPSGACIVVGDDESPEAGPDDGVTRAASPPVDNFVRVRFRKPTHPPTIADWPTDRSTDRSTDGPTDRPSRLHGTMIRARNDSLQTRADVYSQLYRTPGGKPPPERVRVVRGAVRKPSRFVVDAVTMTMIITRNNDTVFFPFFPRPCYYNIILLYIIKRIMFVVFRN